MITNYLGETSLPGLTAKQIAAVEAAIAAAPDQLHDGLWRVVALNIGDVPTSDFIVQAAIASAMADNNVITSFMHPFAICSTAGLPATFMLGATARHVQTNNANALNASARLAADIVKA